MQIARLQNEKSIAELVGKVYNLQPTDPRVATASKVLLAANPHLSDLLKLPTGTPFLVAAISGVTVNSATAKDPRQAVWIGVLDNLLESTRQASNAQLTGTATPETRNVQREPALSTLGRDIDEFKTTHSVSAIAPD